MLWDPATFEPLTDRPWDEAWVREQIREIVADVDDAFDEAGLWAADEWDAWQTPTPLKALYVGAAGVVWALDALRRRGHAESRLDLAAAARRTLESWREEPDLMRGTELPDPARAGLLSGQSGILAVAWRLDSDAAARRRVARAGAREHRQRRRRGHVGLARDDARGPRDARLDGRGALGGSVADERGEAARAPGRGRPVGRSGSTAAPRAGSGRRTASSATCSRCSAAAICSTPRRGRRWSATRPPCSRRTAVIEDDRVNWPNSDGLGLEWEGEIRLQWCCGAPGIVASAASYLDEDLLLAAAETVWQAGAHGPDKGANICHGTAGNGYALLKTFERTQDELWLDRARRFAVHALEQARRARTERGHGRYSLWTGDVGVAVYASDCLDIRTRYPVLEAWD